MSGRKMTVGEYWKNFELGRELSISGNFIYNGLHCFHQMETFHYEDEIFEFLYNLSVGLERLFKIAVVLIEHDVSLNQKEFEESLITHAHLDLLARVRKKHSLQLGNQHNLFLQMLGEFYKSHRYGRYSLEEILKQDNEKNALHKFIEDNLKIEIDDEFPFGITKNDERIKRFIGKIVGKITEELYEVIHAESRRLNLYTYETRYASKACKMFLMKKYDFLDDDILWKELFIFFIKRGTECANISFINKELEALDFDPALASDYMKCFGSDVKKIEIMDELESLYDDLDHKFDREQKVRIIDNEFYDPSEESDD